MKNMNLIHIAGNIGSIVMVSIIILPFFLFLLLPDITSFLKGDHSQTVSIFLSSNSDFKVYFTQSSAGENFVHLNIKEIDFNADLMIKDSKTKNALINAKDPRLLYNANSKRIDKVFLLEENRKVKIDFRQALNRYYEQKKSSQKISNIFRRIEKKERKLTTILICLTVLVCFILPSAVYWYEIFITKKRQTIPATENTPRKRSVVQGETAKKVTQILTALTLFWFIAFYFSLYYPLIIYDDKYMACSVLYGTFIISSGIYCFHLANKVQIQPDSDSRKIKYFSIPVLFIFITIFSFPAITNALPKMLHILSPKKNSIMTVLPAQKVSHEGCRRGFLFDRGKLFRISKKEFCYVDSNIHSSINWGDEFILYGKRSAFGFHMDRYKVVRRK